jgi:glutamate N-acetyltransferase / amino-acid N-acetyltransferase
MDLILEATRVIFLSVESKYPMKILKGGLSNIEGITFSGTKDGKYGLMMAVFDKPLDAAITVTNNKLKAAPIIVTKDKKKLQGFVANSGNANCATAERGVKDAKKMCSLLADKYGLDENQVAVASTGIIGRYLDMGIISNQISSLSLDSSADSSKKAAEAIMTTDTVAKELCIDFGGFKIAGIAKGAGMICPNMATMICFMVTDADAEPELKEAVNGSFNMISIDNDMSTNDIALLVTTRKNKVEQSEFNQAITLFCQEMAKLMVADGEGVSKLIEFEVTAQCESDARAVARHLSQSELIKTAMFGNNPNWGRIGASVGASAEHFDEKKMKISFLINGKKFLLYDGSPREFDFKEASNALKTAKEIGVFVDIGGDSKARSWSGDLSYEYVKINAEYN